MLLNTHKGITLRESKKINFIIMKQHDPIKAGLASHLFWDVDIATLDLNKHASLIVERVIERGTYKNLQFIEQYYGNQQLANIIKDISFMHPKDMMFVHTYFQIPLTELKCYTKKPLIPHYLS